MVDNRSISLIQLLSARVKVKIVTCNHTSSDLASPIQHVLSSYLRKTNYIESYFTLTTTRQI